MNYYTEHYHLYCVNPVCGASIYKELKPVSMPLTEDNLVANHRCQCCHEPLASALDMEISNMLAVANASILKKGSYLLN